MEDCRWPGGKKHVFNSLTCQWASCCGSLLVSKAMVNVMLCVLVAIKKKKKKKMEAVEAVRCQKSLETEVGSMSRYEMS